MSDLQFEMDDVNDVNDVNDIQDKDNDLKQFDLTLKKKKKKKSEKKDVEENKEEVIIYHSNNDDDYDHTFLLNRIFSNIREKNPSLIYRSKKQFVPPPILEKVGSKKTMWVNFSTIVQTLKRDIEHVKSFISSEISSECSIDANYRLIMKGKFNNKHIEPLLKKYIVEYVLCATCKSNETFLSKDPITRLSFIKCDTCKSLKTLLHVKNFRL